jgi:hypothetical protein
MKIRFYREGVKWYADLPTYIEKKLGTVDDLEMVEGAEKGLDFLSDGDTEITLEIRLTINIPLNLALDAGWSILRRLDKGTHSGYHYSGSLVSGEWSKMLNFWLCDVTKFVFNDKFPEHIYVRQCTKGDTDLSPREEEVHQ